MHCGRSWGIWRDSSCKRPKWDSRYYLCVRVHSLEATFAPDTSRPHLDARRPDPSIEHGEEETLSVLRHLLLSSPRELLEELRPTVSSILLCCCYMTGGVLSSEWTNVHPHSPLPPPFICSSTVHSILFVFRAYSRSLPRTLSQMHTHLLVVCFYHFSANCEHTACLAACGVYRSFPNLFVLSNVGRGGICGSSKLKKGG